MLSPLFIHELVNLSDSNRILKIPRQFWYSDVHSEGISIYTKLKIELTSNQSILKEISPGCSLEGMMLKLKLQDFGHLMRRVDSLEKTLMLGRIGGRRKRG